MLKKGMKRRYKIFILFLLIFSMLFLLDINKANALILVDNTSTYSAFFNVTVVDPALDGYSQNYSLYVGITNNLGQEPTGYNVTFFIPYGMRNLTICDGAGGFRNYNLTYEACTMNVAVGLNQQNITNINITAGISALTRFLDAREYVFVNVTSGNISTTSTIVLNPNGIYGFNHWVNPRPYAINNSFNNATLKFISWGQAWNKYEAWVPLYIFNTSGNGTILANKRNAQIIYADKSFFDNPTYFEQVSYRLNFTIYNTTASSDSNASFQIKTANYNKNCQILVPLKTQSFAFTDPFSNKSYNQSIAFATPIGAFDVYYNGIKYNTTNLTTDYGINLTYNSVEAGTNTILNVTAPTRIGNISLSVQFGLSSENSAECTPLLVESQNITGFNPVTDPPDLGESINNSYVISIKNNLTNFTLTNLLVHFVQPINATINITTTIRREFNLTKDLLVLWRETNGTLTNRSAVLYSTTQANFKDNVPGSSSNGSNITIWFRSIDIALNNSVFNYWYPQNASNVTLYMNSTLTFPALNEVDSASGGPGSGNSYNVTVSMSTESPLTIPTSKLDGLNTANCPTVNTCNINITIDGKEVTALNFTIGSVTTKGSLSASTHSISVGYTVPSSGGSSSSGGGSSSLSGGAVTTESLPVNDVKQGETTLTSFMAGGQSFKFAVDKENTHVLTVLYVTNNSAKIRIASDSIVLILELYETKEIDFDHDNVNDMVIRLEEIRNNVLAKFSIKSLAKGEKITEEEGNITSGNITEKTKEKFEIGEQVRTNKNLIVILMILAIVISVIWIINKKRKK